MLKTYHRYEYIAVYDTDEVIVPRGHTNWTGLMADLTLRGRPDSWFFRNVYFFQDSLGLARAEDVEAADVFEGTGSVVVCLVSIFVDEDT